MADARLPDQTRETAKVREAFQKYLALEPDAQDARRVKEYLVELDQCGPALRRLSGRLGSIG